MATQDGGNGRNRRQSAMAQIQEPAPQFAWPPGWMLLTQVNQQLFDRLARAPRAPVRTAGAIGQSRAQIRSSIRSGQPLVNALAAHAKAPAQLRDIGSFHPSQGNQFSSLGHNIFGHPRHRTSVTPVSDHLLPLSPGHTRRGFLPREAQISRRQSAAGRLDPLSVREASVRTGDEIRLAAEETAESNRMRRSRGRKRCSCTPGWE